MKRREWCIIVFIVVMFLSSQAWACTKPDCTHNQEQAQNTEVDTTAIGVGIADSTAISGSSAIVGVNSENDNTNINMNQGGSANVLSQNNSTNVANGGIVEVGGINNQGDTIATAGSSSSEANVQVDNSSGSSYSEGSSAFSGGNTMKNIYNDVNHLDSYNTSVRVGDVEYSTDNISGAVNWQDNGWDKPSAGVEIRYTHAFGTGPAKKALEYETKRIESESLYLNTQINVLNAQKERDADMHALALNKAEMEIALLCEPFLKELNPLKETPASKICNENYGIKNPKVEIKEVVKEVPGPVQWRTSAKKADPVTININSEKCVEVKK